MPFTDNNGIKIHYHTKGQGPHIVLMHGFMGDIGSWDKLGYPDTLALNNTVVTIDGRGHGKSDKPYNPQDYLDKIMATDVIAVLDDIKVEKSHYFGFSMGSRIGFELAAWHQERFLSFILGAQTPGIRNEHGNESSRRRIALFEKGSKEVARVMSRSKKEYDSYLEPTLNGDLKAYIAKTKAIAMREDISRHLVGLTVPCLIYAGESDSLAHESAKEHSEKMPTARFVSLPGLNHMESIARTDMVIPMVKSFLNEVST
jgi:pimeloyl-ACP methyl ester carboxylesterase|tara:strand:- start:1384 stop:2157 length:774 start_codon:yes stop_codon:yes gene_type:complete